MEPKISIIGPIYFGTIIHVTISLFCPGLLLQAFIHVYITILMEAEILFLLIIMKDTKVQTLGARAVAGAWLVNRLLGPGHGYRVQLLIRMRTANN